MSMSQCPVLQQNMPNESSKETQERVSSIASREEEEVEDNEHDKKQNRKMKNKSHVGQQNQLLKNC